MGQRVGLILRVGQGQSLRFNMGQRHCVVRFRVGFRVRERLERLRAVALEGAWVFCFHH